MGASPFSAKDFPKLKAGTSKKPFAGLFLIYYLFAVNTFLVQSMPINLAMRHDTPEMNFPIPDSSDNNAEQEPFLFAYDIVKGPILD